MLIQCDITDPDSLRDSMEQAVFANGDIRALVNNAADDTRHGLSELSVEQWDQGMNVNLRPHFLTAQAVAGGNGALWRRVDH